MLSLSRSGRPRFPVSDKFNSDEQASASHITDEPMPVLQIFTTRQEMVAYTSSAFHESLLFDDVENCVRNRTGYGVSTIL